MFEKLLFILYFRCMNDEAPPRGTPSPSARLRELLSALSGPEIHALAHRSRCSAGYLYQVRRGVVNPGLEIAERVFVGLGTPLVVSEAAQ